MKKQSTRIDAITPAQYRAFQDAYDFFNAELFAASLPHVLVTLQRYPKASGYFSAERFHGRTSNTAVHELAMNPDCFGGRSDGEILSTLVHEMVHVWQQVHGKPSRQSYHNLQWAGKMKEIGLQPSTTGEVGGKETGQSVTHYIIQRGPFAKAYAKLKASGLRLQWQSARGKSDEAKAASKTRFACPRCEQKAWAKSSALLICGNCCRDGKQLSLMLPHRITGS